MTSTRTYQAAVLVEDNFLRLGAQKPTIHEAGHGAGDA